MEVNNRPYVFQVDSDLVKEVYKTRDNYKIVHDDSCINKSLCAIYFSSNDIYYPNEASVFKARIVDKDAFEWYGTRVEGAYKHIFIRDVFKQWYLHGINSKLNSIEKVLEFLKRETEGKEVVIVGSSAGGYAGMLFGQLMQAKKIISFNGQTQLYDLLETTSEDKNPIVFREQDNPIINKYYSILKFVNNPKSIFYFYSNKSAWDLIQYNHIKEKELTFLSYKTKNHGIPFVKVSLLKVINSPIEELIKLARKEQHPIMFSIKINGFVPVYKALKSQVIKKLKSKLN
ncbi:hypothetical protein SAMN05216480_101549 [Pustulibacterium marinum]|uniref:Uncharacterized protein n=1 Tax=Pustulibacterium marinum TaxID=1224947 RepID=A0A1I7F1Y2_9FLAO|nr:hypothetical protein [Pustulibacterium marinum]SFU30198.1 hypothetical protein SAMN05216480_101549 [Pustulibacterium marinum]